MAKAPMTDLHRSHAELRAALRLAGKEIKRLKISIGAGKSCPASGMRFEDRIIRAWTKTGSARTSERHDGQD
jgi:hypothetical protein